MSKCYVFAIGGTGSRVLFSLVNLMAAGCDYDFNPDDPHNPEITEIVPIVIDMHEGNNQNKDRTIHALTLYSLIREKIRKEDTKSVNRFFRYQVTDLVNGFNLPPLGHMPRVNLINNSIGSVIAKSTLAGTLDPTNKLIDLLISKDKQNEDLNVGFKGVPSLGAIVMNEIRNSEQFIQLFNQFQAGDKIIVIGSLFGGTGASGIPVIAKTIRHCSSIPTFPNANVVSRAPIAAVMVLPYFLIPPSDQSPINSDNFIRNTKAALRYYERQGDLFNSVYYVADALTPLVHATNDPGENGQNNKAHFTEVIAAKQVLHFLGQKITVGQPTQGYEYGLTELNPNFTANLNLAHINDQSGLINERFSKPLIRFYLAQLCVLNKGIALKNEPWMIKAGLIKKPIWGKSKDFLTTGDFALIERFMSKYYHTWLRELKEFGKFEPFEVNPQEEKLYASIRHKPPIAINSNTYWDSYTQMSADFSDIASKCNVQDSDSARFLDILHRGIDGFIKKYGI